MEQEIILYSTLSYPVNHIVLHLESPMGLNLWEIKRNMLKLLFRYPAEINKISANAGTATIAMGSHSVISKRNKTMKFYLHQPSMHDQIAIYFKDRDDR